MLFDDPIDNSGQLVSELVIPKAPGNPGEDPDKLPATADQVMNIPDPASEGAGIEEAPEQAMDAPDDNSSAMESDLLPDAAEEEEMEQPNAQLKPDPHKSHRPSTEASDSGMVDVEEEQENAGTRRSADSLDTGVVAQATKPVKNIEAIRPRQVKPVNADIVAKAKKPVVKKTEINTSRQASAAKPVTLAAANTAVKSVNKPSKSPELVRWYIQAGTFSQKENAVSLSDTLKKQGFPVLLETIKIADKGTLYRLKVGPELDKKRAAAMKAKLDGQNINNILVSE
jgi:DedD protein